MAGVKRKLSTETDCHAVHKELDEVSCPVCLDHPHNAVLLMCSSHEKGCRSYICDTSYRHSNCLDRFKKLHSESSPNDINETQNELGGLASRSSFHRESANRGGSVMESESLRRRRRRVEETEEEEEEERSEDITNLKCPLCRGTVFGWKVVEEVRTYLDLKNRSCSRESCSFTGNYQDLRRHARRTHPTTRPSDTDPSRERAWRRLENQREYGDIMSALRSTIPGAVVVGDYVIEHGDRFSGERENGNGGGSDMWTTVLLFSMLDSLGNGGPSGSSSGSVGVGGGGGGGSRSHRSRAWRNHRRSSSDRRYLWGENLLGLQDEHNNNNNDDDEEELRLLNDIGNDDDSSTHVPRRRRRFGRPRSSSGNHHPR